MTQANEELTPLTIPVSRADARAYAAASGDHNPIHQDDAAARALGLPGVIIHGMWTMGAALRIVSEVLPGKQVREVTCAFTSPVPLPADGAAELVVTGTQPADDQLKLEVRDAAADTRVARLAVRVD